jgi:hypothetical protein
VIIFSSRLVKMFVLLLAPNISFAGCWNADDYDSQGSAVEICFEGQCENTFMITECAGGWGAIIEYRSGWSLNTEFVDGVERRRISRNGSELNESQMQQVSCTDLDENFGCRFASFMPEDEIDVQIELERIKVIFNQAHDANARFIQMSLIDANLYRGAYDGLWGPQMETAFTVALEWASETDLYPVINTEMDLYTFLPNLRYGLFLDDGSWYDEGSDMEGTEEYEYPD